MTVIFLPRYRNTGAEPWTRATGETVPPGEEFTPTEKEHQRLQRRRGSPWAQGVKEVEVEGEGEGARSPAQSEETLGGEREGEDHRSPVGLSAGGAPKKKKGKAQATPLTAPPNVDVFRGPRSRGTLLSAEDLAELQAIAAEALRRGIPVPERIDHALLQHEAIKRGIFPYDTFREFVEALNPTLLRWEHVPKMIEVCQRVVDGELGNVMFLIPTRYGKSEVVSRLLPAYYLRKFSDRTVGLACYGADLAWELAGHARDNFEATHGTFASDSQAKKHWGTKDGGEMWAAGVGGPGLGRGFHLGLVDDPMDPRHAFSGPYQRRFVDYWPGKFLRAREPMPNNRLAPVIFVMQRLGAEDPIDYLFRREVGDGIECAPMHWHVVVMDEIKSDEPFGRWEGPRGLPPTCTLEPDEREVGQVLAPSRYSVQQVKEAQESSSPLVVAAQRQQRPMSPTGDFWQKSWFELRVYDELPSDAHNGGKDWDTAFTKNETNAASAWVETYRGAAPPKHPERFPIYVHDLGWGWWKFPQLVEEMMDLGGPHHVEAKASGKSAAQTLAAHSIPVTEVPVLGDKLMRASAAQPVASSGRIYVRRAVLQLLLYGEQQGLLRVTVEALKEDSAGLDLNDAFVQSIHRHLGIGAKGKKKKPFVFAR